MGEALPFCRAEWRLDYWLLPASGSWGKGCWKYNLAESKLRLLMASLPLPRGLLGLEGQGAEVPTEEGLVVPDPPPGPGCCFPAHPTSDFWPRGG